MTGTISHANVNVNSKSGDLTGVDLQDGSAAVVGTKLTSGTLRITEEDGQQFDMKVLRADLSDVEQSLLRQHSEPGCKTGLVLFAGFPPIK